MISFHIGIDAEVEVLPSRANPPECETWRGISSPKRAADLAYGAAIKVGHPDASAIKKNALWPVSDRQAAKVGAISGPQPVTLSALDEAIQTLAPSNAIPKTCCPEPPPNVPCTFRRWRERS